MTAVKQPVVCQGDLFDTAMSYAAVTCEEDVEFGQPWHRHGADECLLVYRGEVEVAVRDATGVVATTRATISEQTIIPAGVEHRVSGRGVVIELVLARGERFHLPDEAP